MCDDAEEARKRVVGPSNPSGAYAYGNDRFVNYRKATITLCFESFPCFVSEFPFSYSSYSSYIFKRVNVSFFII